MLSLLSCQPKVDKDLQWPEWASRPLISAASLTTTDGEHTLEPGTNVILKAHIEDEYCELSSYEVTIKYGENVIWEQKSPASGSSTDINEEFIMPFAPGLVSGGLIPEVTITAYNVKNGMISKRIDNESNVTVNRPKLPQTLYLVDDKGNVFNLFAASNSYLYKPEEGTDFSNLGTKFHLAEKVSGSSPDFSGIVWGIENGKISVVSSASPIVTPDTGGYGIKNLSFNSLDFQMEKLVNLSILLDKSKMDTEEQNGVKYYVLRDVELVKDCEFVFEGFGNLKSMLQPDRFEIISDKTAKFIGHETLWSIYYDELDNWLIVNYASFGAKDQVWITGVKSCFPLGNVDTEHEFKWLEGDGKVRYATLSLIKDENNDFSCQVFLKKDFVLQFYRCVRWTTVISMKSLTPDYAKISEDGLYVNPGERFQPGLYEIHLQITKDSDANDNGCVVDLSMKPLNNN